MPKASTRKAQRLIPRFSPTMQARADKRELQQRIRLEKDVQRLARELERRIRASDYRLVDLAARLLSRGVAVEGAREARAKLDTPPASDVAAEQTL